MEIELLEVDSVASKTARELAQFDEQFRLEIHPLVAGIDEAGRGPLAGPVVAAACIIPWGCVIDGVNDSKQLTPEARADCLSRMKANPEILWGVGIIHSKKIDRVNIYQATILAMKAAINALPVVPHKILVDGMKISHKRIPCEKIIDGDAKSLRVGAASIFAKETRDQIMRDYHKKYPKYGFDRHKGYATPEHLRTLELYGPCPIHRISFSPVAKELVV